MPPDDIDLRIARLELQPGDILVVRTSRPPGWSDLHSFLPSGVRVMYITPDVELSVLTKAEIDARAK